MMTDVNEAPHIDQLLAIMAKLRDPDGGCPWDLEQSFASIAPYTVEEAYEVAEAISRNDLSALADELGDLLLQVVFHAQMAQEQNAFDFSDVVGAICAKMIRRHPHVFGDDGPVMTSAEQTEAWEAIKAEERQVNHEPGAMPSAMSGITSGLPPLLRAQKIQKRAARVNFDWADASGVMEKVREEMHELETAMTEQDRSGIQHELGDLLFTCVNLARHLDVDPGQSLSEANDRFVDRFHAMERKAGSCDVIKAMADEEREALWQSVKATSS